MNVCTGTNSKGGLASREAGIDRWEANLEGRDLNDLLCPNLILARFRFDLKQKPFHNTTRHNINLIFLFTTTVGEMKIEIVNFSSSVGMHPTIELNLRLRDGIIKSMTDILAIYAIPRTAYVDLFEVNKV